MEGEPLDAPQQYQNYPAEMPKLLDTGLSKKNEMCSDHTCKFATDTPEQYGWINL
jgi:hypothetical protein